MGDFAIGQPVPRFEDPRLLRGGGRYVDDLKRPGMAYGFVLRSPFPHARIAQIDAEAARRGPGVLAVFTGSDWEASGFGPLPSGAGMKLRDGRPMVRPKYQALATDVVRWIGDPVAFVVAETLAQAVDAAELIVVDYDPLPAVVDCESALAEGAPAVWAEAPDNVCFVYTAGNAAAAAAAIDTARHVVRHRFDINRVTAATMEPRGCVGEYERFEDRYTIHTTLQRTHVFRQELAENVLRVPETHIRVVCGDVGGSFGMKSPVFNEVALVLLAAREVGRPVKWTCTRSESFLADAQARDNVTEAELALDENGIFQGLRVRTLANLGAWPQTASTAFVGNAGTLAGVYRTPACHVDITAVFTNTNPIRPFRGNGRPEAAYVIERMVDLAAAELGIPAVELRRRNLIGAEQMPFRTGLTFTYDSGDFATTMRLALHEAAAEGFEARRGAARARGKLRGLGLSNTIERAGGSGYEGAEVRFDRTGSVRLLTGAVTQGQGHETIFKQIVCDMLGLDPADVQYVQGDTDQVGFGEGTGGSRTSSIGGTAVSMAAQRVLGKARRIAAHLLHVEEAEIDFNEGIFASARSNRQLTIKDIARAAATPTALPNEIEPGLIGHAVYNTQDANFPNGCHICELEIDAETGEVELLRYTVVDDVGVVLNPLLLHGQVMGGVAQGIGQALMEDIVFDRETGQILTGSFMDYAMPRADDLCDMEVESHPVPTPTNPLGVKGAGEAGCVGALPAVANALADALAPLGIRHPPMPATPFALWRAMQAARMI
jgi:aerobic carbon-monoxide dehydrogenase large subunit